MTDPECAVHVRRLGDLEKRAESSHVKSHQLANTVTELKMQTDLLDLEHEHLKKDFWEAMERQREAARDNAAAASDMVRAQQDQLLAMEKISSRQQSTDKVLKWVLAVITGVGTGTAIVVISQALTQTAA